MLFCSRRSYALPLLTLLAGYVACSPDGTSGDGDGGDSQLSGGQNGSGAAPSGSGGSADPGAGGMSSGGGAGSGGSTGGSGGEGAGSGGMTASGGAPTVELGPIMRSDSSYVLEFSGYFFEVDPTQAAVVKTFSLEGDNILVPVEFKNDFINGGSAFWIAPQDPDWGWPPPSAMDSDAYAASIAGNTIEAVGPAFELSGTGNTLSIDKAFSPNFDEGAIDMTFTIKNQGPDVAKHAPWQITRVDRGGITFWAAGEGTCGADPAVPTLSDGVYFWNDAELGTDLTNNKFSCDGAGWLAHLSGSLLLIKTWTDVPAAMQHEVDKEIQLYFGDGYEEVEMRGAYQDIAVDGAANWDVRWYLRPAPADTSEAGLVAAVDAVIP